MGNYRKLTEQDILNIAANGVLEQGTISGTKNIAGPGTSYFCKYRGPNGLKCAAGHVILDEDYDPEMDDFDNDCGISTIILRYEQLSSLYKFQELLDNLQKWHDDCAKYEYHKKDFRKEAYNHLKNMISIKHPHLHLDNIKNYETD